MLRHDQKIEQREDTNVCVGERERERGAYILQTVVEFFEQ